MPKRYSPEIRRAALELVNQGQTQIDVAQALGTCALPKQQQNLVADFRRSFLAHKTVPRKCLAFWGQFIFGGQFKGRLTSRKLVLCREGRYLRYLQTSTWMNSTRSWRNAVTDLPDMQTIL